MEIFLAVFFLCSTNHVLNLSLPSGRPVIIRKMACDVVLHLSVFQSRDQHFAAAVVQVVTRHETQSYFLSIGFSCGLSDSILNSLIGSNS